MHKDRFFWLKTGMLHAAFVCACYLFNRKRGVLFYSGVVA